ncbi:MAG: uracil-DNA glycosylase, partial [Clostridia bacterium]|nr:uracil-DNA glycosylase [Clostridia bacterium]
GGIVNRPPTKKEIDAFRPWLLKEIELVNPEVVVTLGNVPLQAVAGDKRVIGDWHGQFVDISGRRLYPMYHPAAIIYNRSLSVVYEADVIALGEALRENLQKNPSNSDLN